MSAFACFASTFVAVFALGFQSQNVNQGHYVAAALTSVAIGVSSIFLYKLMPESGPLEILGYLVGGVTGITASMWVHRRTLGKKHVSTGISRPSARPQSSPRIVGTGISRPSPWPQPPGQRIVREGVPPPDDTN